MNDNGPDRTSCPFGCGWSLIHLAPVSAAELTPMIREHVIEAHGPGETRDLVLDLSRRMDDVNTEGELQPEVAHLSSRIAALRQVLDDWH